MHTIITKTTGETISKHRSLKAAVTAWQDLQDQARYYRSIEILDTHGIVMSGDDRAGVA